MEIIMLSGDGECGKSTTLNLVYDSINPQSADIIAEKTTIGNPVNMDFECIIRYKGRTVAFYTMGDYSTDLTGAFKRYNDWPCDVLVCACNIKFTHPYQEIENYMHIVLSKTMPLNNQSNEIDKRRILQLL